MSGRMPESYPGEDSTIFDGLPGGPDLLSVESIARQCMRVLREDESHKELALVQAATILRAIARNVRLGREAVILSYPDDEGQGTAG